MALIIICSSIYLYLTRNVYSVYLIFFLYGIGQGISVKITRVNFVKYYYNRKGLIQDELYRVIPYVGKDDEDKFYNNNEKISNSDGNDITHPYYNMRHMEH